MMQYGLDKHSSPYDPEMGNNASSSKYKTYQRDVTGWKCNLKSEARNLKSLIKELGASRFLKDQLK